MVFQHGLDPFHVGLGLVVLGLQGVQLVGLLLEEAQDALLLLLAWRQSSSARRSGSVIRSPTSPRSLVDTLERRCLGEIADLFLAGCTVLQHLLAVGDVDLLGELIHHGLLLRGQLHLCLRGAGVPAGRARPSLRAGAGSSVRVGTAGASRSKLSVIVCHKRFLPFPNPEGIPSFTSESLPLGACSATP